MSDIAKQMAAEIKELQNDPEFLAEQVRIAIGEIRARDAIIARLEKALERELDGCRRICAGSVAALNKPDMQRHFHRQLDRLKAALAQKDKA